MKKLSEYKVLAFDVYGTLIDWESGMVEALKPSQIASPRLTRDEALEAHAYHESTTQLWTPNKSIRIFWLWYTVVLPKNGGQR